MSENSSSSHPPQTLHGDSTGGNLEIGEWFGGFCGNSPYLPLTRFPPKGVNYSHPTRPTVLCIDIDDTVLRHWPRKPDYVDPESILENCRPIWAACERTLALIEEGHEVHFITGRHDVVKSATLAQLKTWISTRILREHVHCNGVWAGYDALQAHKAERLRFLGASLMVGDHAADEAAAMDAGIPFLHADAFAAGAPLPLLTTPFPLLSVN